MRSTLYAAAVLTLLGAGAVQAGVPEEYQQAISATAQMVSNPQLQKIAQGHGLQILNLTWEDTGRFKGSCVGPNISDMTLQVQTQDPHTQGYRLTCMPVIRFPNFEDKTADLKPEDFYVLVGNEKQQPDGQPLHKVSLRQLLGDPRRYMSRPQTWTGNQQSLLAPRDTHVLVSAQACFLPIPKQGQAQFNPVLFNYVSSKNNPAVLTLLATREGTSMTIIDNVRDGFEAGQTWGQRIFFNQHGQRASLTGQRLSDFQAGPNATGPQAAGQQGLNMVLLVQVPLKHKETPMNLCCDACAPTMAAGACERASKSDMEAAVIGHGKVEGPFTEMDNLAIERDPNFPIRVTVQFYQATSNGQVGDAELASLADQINKVYAHADYVGSLVTGGDTGRPTEYVGNKQEPSNWWEHFWQRHLQNTGQSPWDVRKLWEQLNLKARAQ